MKALKLFPILVLLFFSCEEKKEVDDMDDMSEQAEIREPSEAYDQWIAAWNKNDAVQLDTLTASNAVLYMQGRSMNADSIKAWYKQAAPMMSNLKTTSEVSYSNDDVAYNAGTYRHGIKGDTTGVSYEGAYTFIWKRSGNDWKLEVMNITDKTPDTSSTNM